MLSGKEEEGREEGKIDKDSFLPSFHVLNQIKLLWDRVTAPFYVLVEIRQVVFFNRTVHVKVLQEVVLFFSCGTSIVFWQNKGLWLLLFLWPGCGRRTALPDYQVELREGYRQ